MLCAQGVHFIRCLKPNARMVSRTFDGSSVLTQLQYSGMMSVLELMQRGYPSRTPFAELYALYANTLPKQLARLEPRLFCRVLGFIIIIFMHIFG